MILLQSEIKPKFLIIVAVIALTSSSMENCCAYDLPFLSTQQSQRQRQRQRDDKQANTLRALIMENFSRLATVLKLLM